MTTIQQGFASCLATSIYVGTKARVYQVSTPATEAEQSLFGPFEDTSFYEKHRDLAEPTSIEWQFLFLTQDVTDINHRTHEVAVFAIEICVYTTKSFTAIYVSKADSTGLAARPHHDTRVRDAVLSAGVVFSRFLEYLTIRYMTKNSKNNASDAFVPNQSNRKVWISLCAKSQNQYLFPGSIENSTKRVLEDRSLIRWWCRALNQTMQYVQERSQQDTVPNTAADNLIQSSSSHSLVKGVTINAYVIVPGLEAHEVERRFFPANTLSNGHLRNETWHSRYPVERLMPRYDAGTPIPFLIPIFDDDPKARLWHDQNQSLLPSGAWKSANTLADFWTLLANRREFASGHVAGLMWLVFEQKEAEVILGEHDIKRSGGSETHVDHIRDQAASSPLVCASSEAVISLEAFEQWRDDTIVDRSDFAGLPAAAESTKLWINEIERLAGIDNFGESMEGRLPLVVTADADSGQVTQGTQDTRTSPAVNMLVGRKQKKRKAESQPTTHSLVQAVKSAQKSTNGSHDDTKTTAGIHNHMINDSSEITIQDSHQALESSDTNLLDESMHRKKIKILTDQHQNSSESPRN